MSSGDIYKKIDGAYVLQGNIGGGSSGVGGSDISYFNQVGTSPWERWYSSAPVTTNTAVGIRNNQLIGIPFISPRGGTVDRIGTIATTDTGNVHFGIYQATSETNLYPHDLISDSLINVNATGLIAATINITFLPGVLYWLVSICETDLQPFCRGLNVSKEYGISRLLGMNAGLTGTSYYCRVYPYTYGALPDPFPANATLPDCDPASPPSLPFVAVRYSA